MTLEFILVVMAVLFGFYVAWNIGANDVANAVGTSVGSGSLTIKQAVVLAAIFEFAGAFFFGSNVAETIEAGIVNPDFFKDDYSIYILGMLASLLGTGVWLQIATTCGWPVSTTHTIVGAVVGFGLIQATASAIFWGEILSIALSWLLSPLLGGSLAYLIFTYIRKRVFYHPKPISATKQITPYIVFFMFFVLSLIIFFQGLQNMDLHLSFFESVIISFLVGGVASLLSYFVVRRVKDVPREPKHEATPLAIIELRKARKHLEMVGNSSQGEIHTRVEGVLKEVHELSKSAGNEEAYFRSSMEYRPVEKIFGMLQIITACFMSFAHGSNDVANAIGPLSAIFNLLQGKEILSSTTVPLWLLFLGAVGIVIGLATFGFKVIETVGKKITDLTPSRGFSVGLAAAITVVLASKLGLPVSTTHVIVGAVLGVGFARGIGALNLNVVRDIVISWIVTVPAGAILTILFFYLFKALFI